MIELTKKASNKAKELIQNESDMEGLRLQVFPGGCSGFVYHFSFAKETKDNDKIIANKGVKLIIDEKSLSFIEGSEIDYLDTLQGAGFIVKNPNAIEKCHCGKSFK